MAVTKSLVFFCVCLGLIGGMSLRVYGVFFVPIALIAALGILLGLFFLIIRNHAAVILISIAVCVLTGFLYTHLWIDREYTLIRFGEEILVEGSVHSYPRLSEFGKGFLLETEYGNLQLYTSFAQEAQYNDVFIVKGTIEALSETQQYLKKDLAQGVIKNPEIVGYSKGNTSIVRSLYRFRTHIRDIFVRILPYDKASLATGLLIGGGSISFPRELKSEMQNSGTTHIVALSGYNISMIILWVYAILGFILSRKWTFWLTIGVVVVFTVMTGAEASIVRASCMGILVIISQHIGRVYSFRQSAVAVACVMLIINPYAIRYDAGFSLSFLSLFGIVYLAPLFLYSLKRFRFGSAQVTKIACETIAAQVAVLPVLIFLFNGFSFAAIVANVLILPMVPIAMGLSFGIACVSFFSIQLAHIISFMLRPALEYVLAVVHAFGSAERTAFSKSIPLSALYYAVIICVLTYAKKKKICFNTIQT